MTTRLTLFKERLATIRMGSWRYQMTQGIWNERRINDTHACTFYWWYMPTSVLAWIVIGLAYCAFIIIVYALIVPIGWLLGFTPQRGDRLPHRNEDPMRNWTWHGGYGYEPITKRRHVIAYQHVLLFLAAITVIAYFGGSIAWRSVFIWTGIVLGGLTFLALLGFLLSRQALREAWHRICPELNIDQGSPHEIIGDTGPNDLNPV